MSASLVLKAYCPGECIPCCGLLVRLRALVPAITRVDDTTVAACQRRESPDDGVTAVFTGVGQTDDRRRIAEGLRRELTAHFGNQNVYICFLE